MDLYLNRLNSDEIAEILLLLEPQDLDQFCQINDYIQSVCQKSEFKERYEMKWHKSIRDKYSEQKDIFSGLRYAGILGSDQLFWFFFNKIPLTGHILVKRDAFIRAIEEASELGSFKFALQLFEQMKDYFENVEHINIKDKEVIRIYFRLAKSLIVFWLSKRGDIDGAISLAKQFKVLPEWILGGQILATNGNNINELERKLNTSIDSDNLADYIIGRLIKKRISKLWIFLDKYPGFAKNASLIALRKNNFNLFTEIINRYPVTINIQHLFEAMRSHSPELFDTIFDLLPRSPRPRLLAMLLTRSISDPILFDHLLNKFYDDLPKILLAAHPQDLLILIKRNIINEDIRDKLLNIIPNNEGEIDNLNNIKIFLKSLDEVLSTLRG